MASRSQDFSPALQTAFANPGVASFLDSLFPANHSHTIGDPFALLTETLRRHLPEEAWPLCSDLMSGMSGPVNFRIKGGLQQHPYVARLAKVRQRAGAHCSAPPVQPPSIECLTTFKFGPPCQEVTRGERIDGAAPGTILTIVGRNFCEAAAGNLVRFDDQAVPVALATRSMLVVCVPPIFAHRPRSLNDHKTGEVTISVETLAGTAETRFQIKKPPPVRASSGSFERFFDQVRAIEAQLSAHSALHRPWMDSAVMAADPSGALLELAQAEPMMSSQIVQQLDRLREVAKSIATPEFNQLADSIVAASGICPELDALLEEGRSEDISLLRGSGFIEYFCRAVKWMWITFFVLFVLFIILIVLAIILLETGPVAIVIAVIATIVAFLMVYTAFKAVWYTIKYILLRLWEWWTSPASIRPEPPSEVPGGSGWSGGG